MYNCTTTNYCENNPTDELCTATRSTFWLGEVALMYPSDYYLVYANDVDSICYGQLSTCQAGISASFGTPSASWIHNSNVFEGQSNIIDNWFITPISSCAYCTLMNTLQGSMYESLAEGLNGVRPVLYLSSNVKITDGTGEQNNPYKLGL